MANWLLFSAANLHADNVTGRIRGTHWHLGCREADKTEDTTAAAYI